LLAFGGTIAVSVLFSRREKRRQRALLAKVGEKYGAAVQVPAIGNPFLQLTRDDGTTIVIKTWQTDGDQTTEIVARIAAPGLPQCRILPPGSNTLKAFRQDIEIGDPVFDDTFKVKGEDPVLVQRMWREPHVRALALRVNGTYVESNGRDVKVLQDVSARAVHIEAGIELVFELVRSDPYGMGVLAELPEAQIRRDPDGFAQAHLPGLVIVGPYSNGEVVRTCVRTARGGELAVDAATLVTEAGASLQVADDELRIWFSGIETDVARLTAAAELARRLSSPPAHGVFR
jgi:hypothetical protein